MAEKYTEVFGFSYVQNLLTSCMLFLTSNLKVGLQQMWGKEKFKEPFLIFARADKNHFLDSSFCSRKEISSLCSNPKIVLHPKTSTQRWGRVDNSTNCDKGRCLGKLDNIFFLTKLRILRVELSWSGTRSTVAEYIHHLSQSKLLQLTSSKLEYLQSVYIYLLQL